MGDHLGSFSSQSSEFWEESPESFTVPNWLSDELRSMKKLYFLPCCEGDPDCDENMELHVLKLTMGGEFRYEKVVQVMVHEYGTMIDRKCRPTGRFIEMSRGRELADLKMQNLDA